MEHSVFYHFYKNAGFNVYTSRSAEWCAIQRGMLLSIPYHRLITPSQDELDDLLELSGVWGVRFPTSVENYGFSSKLEVCSQFGYNLQSLKHKFRNRVQKGEQYCQIRPVGIQELKNDGYRLNLQTLRRQKRNDPRANQKYWWKICDALDQTRDVRVLGAYYQERLAAYVVIMETPSMAEMIIQNSDSELLGYCPNNLLTYHVTWHYLTERNNPVPLCYGLGSLEDTPDLDRYKVGMGYVMKPIKQRLYFRKGVRFWLKPAILSPILFMGELIDRHIIKGRSYLLDKCCAMGKRYMEQS